MSVDWLYIASSPFPSTAANSVHVAKMCSAIVRTGAGLIVVSPWEYLTPTPTGGGWEYGISRSIPIRYLFRPKIRGGNALFRFLMRRALTSLRPNLVYGRSLEGCRVAAEKGYRTVLEIHKPEWELSSKYKNEFDKLLNASGFRAIVCISAALQECLIDTFPKLTEHTFVAHDAAPSWVLRTPLTESDKFVVGYFGSLNRGKGVETILKLASLCPWALFRIVGGDKKQQRAWATGKDVPENVQFFVHQPHDVLPEMMADCDVLVAPYLNRVEVHGGGGDVSAWMSPLKIFEYMAVGRPIVCADLPVLREVLRDEENALLVRPGDVTAWQRALERLKKDKLLCHRLAKQARIEHEQSYTWDMRAEKVIGELQRLGILVNR